MTGQLAVVEEQLIPAAMRVCDDEFRPIGADFGHGPEQNRNSEERTMESDEARARRVLGEMSAMFSAGGEVHRSLGELTTAVEAIIAKAASNTRRGLEMYEALLPFARYSEALGDGRASQTCNGVKIDEVDMRRAAQVLGRR